MIASAVLAIPFFFQLTTVPPPTYPFLFDGYYDFFHELKLTSRKMSKVDTTLYGGMGVLKIYDDDGLRSLPRGVWGTV